jgi:hypothetical protein
MWSVQVERRLGNLQGRKERGPVGIWLRKQHDETPKLSDRSGEEGRGPTKRNTGGGSSITVHCMHVRCKYHHETPSCNYFMLIKTKTYKKNVKGHSRTQVEAVTSAGGGEGHRGRCRGTEVTGLTGGRARVRSHPWPRFSEWGRGQWQKCLSKSNTEM